VPGAAVPGGLGAAEGFGALTVAEKMGNSGDPSSIINGYSLYIGLYYGYNSYNNPEYIGSILHLVGDLEHVFFHSVGNFIFPTDELHHFSEG